jgi:hypothetical protein
MMQDADLATAGLSKHSLSENLQNCIEYIKGLNTLFGSFAAPWVPKDHG